MLLVALDAVGLGAVVMTIPFLGDEPSGLSTSAQQIEVAANVEDQISCSSAPSPEQ